MKTRPGRSISRAPLFSNEFTLKSGVCGRLGFSAPIMQKE